MNDANINTAVPENLWQEFREYAGTAFGAALPDAALDSFRAYLNDLVEWNSKFNLVSVRSAEEVLFRHFADSLAGLKAAAGCAGPRSVIDIGTGAGFPGLPLKIVCPQWKLTLLESIQKKCSFLEHMVERLSLNDTSVLNERAEVLGQDKRFRGQYDIVLSRAVSKLSPNLEFSLPFLKKGGLALIYKTEASLPAGEEARHMADVAHTLGGESGETFRYTLPREERTFGIMVVKKQADTPPQYPRRTGVPEKKPL